MTALDDCFLHDRDRLRHHDAVELLRDGLAPATKSIDVPFKQALGRVLAEDVVAERSVPLRTNAAVDGYAYAREGGELRPVSLRIRAGDDVSTLPDGTAARIFTGAPVPLGADIVAMQEDCEIVGDDIRLPTLRTGANIRRSGEDVAAGTMVVRSGTVIDARHIARFASLGLQVTSVREPLRVALFSTGDEIGHDVLDANLPMIEALCDRLPVSVSTSAVLPDRRADVEGALRRAAGSSDLVVTTGGASRGEEDHVLDVLDRIGRRKAWQIAVKPGRPLMFGTIGSCAFMGLPGNPVAAFVCFLLYTRPAILRMAGAEWSDPPRFIIPAGFAHGSKPDRREFLRGRIGGDGRLAKFERDGSGLISGLTGSDGLIEIAEETTRVEPGDMLPFMPFAGLV